MEQMVDAFGWKIEYKNSIHEPKLLKNDILKQLLP